MRLRYLFLVLLVGVLSLPACKTLSYLEGEEGAARGQAEEAPAPTLDMNAGVGAPVRVTALLPLSGKEAALGEAMQNAATLAFTDRGYAAFELLFEDTGSSSAGAAAAAQRAVTAGSNMILGPIFADEARAAGTVASRAGIPLISFSTDLSAAAPGRFVMGLLPQDQAAAAARFAAQQGLDNILVVAPQTPYGQITVRAFSDAAIAAGTTVLPPVWVAAGQTSLPNLASILTAAPVQTVFLPLPPAQAAALLPALRSVTGAGHLTILGTALLDEPSVATTYTALEGAFYAVPAGAARARFLSRYEQTYGTAAPRLASLAYDATSLALVLGRAGLLNEHLSVKLTDPSGYAGVDGAFRFTANGAVERQLDIVRLTATGRVLQAAAPSHFATQKP